MLLEIVRQLIGSMVEGLIGQVSLTVNNGNSLWPSLGLRLNMLMNSALFHRLDRRLLAPAF